MRYGQTQYRHILGLGVGWYGLLGVTPTRQHPLMCMIIGPIVEWAELGWAGPQYPSVPMRDRAEGKIDQQLYPSVCTSNRLNLTLYQLAHTDSSLKSAQAWFLGELPN